jgi:hypothetical protein
MGSRLEIPGLLATRVRGQLGIPRDHVCVSAARLPGWSKLALVLTAVATFLWFLVRFFREYRSDDERMRRVQGDGCAYAVGVSIIWALGMWTMNLGPERTHDANQSVLYMLPFGYWVGIFVSKGGNLPLGTRGLS